MESSGMEDKKLYGTFAPMVAGICWRILGHRADAEDAAQETFLKAYELSEKEPIRHWPGLLRRLATTSALARLRSRRLLLNVEDTEPFSREKTPQESLEQKELQARLRGAIAKLPPRDAEVFCLRYLENLSHEDIVESLELPYASVTSAIYRARKRLEAEFADLRMEDRQ